MTRILASDDCPVPKAGGVVVTMADGQGGPYDLAQDAEAIYWTNAGNGTVMKVAK